MKAVISFIERHSIGIAAALILTTALFFISTSLWKEANLRYNALDLAIYTNVLWNLTHGHGVYSSIQQSNYFGDHFEPLLLVLAPIFALFPSPKTLVVIQALLLALAGWPVYLVAQHITRRRTLALLATALFLANPLLGNINAMEFHMLSFALPLLLFASYAYLKQRFGHFILFSVLTLLVREDLALILFAFGFLALLERRGGAWVLFPFIASTLWFLGSLAVTSSLSPSAGYKFLAVYDWGDKSTFEILATIFSRLGNYELIGGLLLAFLFLPLLAPRFLILAVPPLLQFLLVTFGSSGDVLKAHYSVVFFPGLLLASIAGLKKICTSASPSTPRSWYFTLIRERSLVVAVLAVLFVGSHVALGPTGPIIAQAFTGAHDGRMELRQSMLSEIKQSEPCVGTLDVLTPLATRKNVSSFHYLFSGRKQLSFAPYTMPPDTSCFFIDSEELLGYPIQVQSPEETEQSFSKMRHLLLEGDFSLMQSLDGFLLFQRGTPGHDPLFVSKRMPQGESILRGRTTGEDVHIVSTQDSAVHMLKMPDGASFPFLTFSPSFTAVSSTQENYKLLFRLSDASGKVLHEMLYPLAGGLYQTSEWKAGELVRSNEQFLLPAHLGGKAASASIQLVRAKVFFSLDGIRSIAHLVRDTTPVGEEVSLGEILIP